MKQKWIYVLLAIAILVGGVAYAQATQDLQPTFRLMDGEEEMGLVWGLDYGWVIMSGEEPIYTCGCNIPGCDECECDPIKTPTPPTETPPPPPTEEPNESCNRGIGNGAEDCDPGNSSGQGGGQGRGAGEDKDE